MSPTTVAKLEIKPLPHPDGASGGLNAIIDAVEEHINRSILLLATGEPEDAPDFTTWLEGKELPGESDLQKPVDEADLVDKYTDRQQEVKSLTANLDRENKSINDSQVAAFSLSNNTYRNIAKIVLELRDTLGEDAPAPTKGVDGVYRLSPLAEIGLLLALLDAADRVHDEVQDAANGIETHAGDIAGSVPNAPRGYDNNNGGVPAASNAYRPAPASKASYRITDPPDPIGEALRVAGKEVGTEENDEAFGSKPYNNGSAWCAAFTSWVWKEAGYDVTWTDFDYVPAVWNDAEALDLRRPSPADAQPGDLIVFDWEGDGTPDHIGIVETVSGGMIHTIEGNSSDRVQRLDYSMNAGEVVGVIKPPPTGSGADVRV